MAPFKNSRKINNMQGRQIFVAPTFSSLLNPANYTIFTIIDKEKVKTRIFIWFDESYEQPDDSRCGERVEGELLCWDPADTKPGKKGGLLARTMLNKNKFG